ncbi:hypothetical protein [Streptomyces sp. LMG1-1-1.1]|uniref:hypothetical protein n=1 Tax=Streptomyces sp. LMG1-1-1.1 TaxID=3135245 RepID=UPI0034675836
MLRSLPSAAYPEELAGLPGVTLVPRDTAGPLALAGVLAGLRHDSVLGEEERASGTTMMICVGRSRGPRLALDL